MFSELAKVTNPLLDGVLFWRSKAGAEVDFVVRRQGRIAGIEVKAGAAHGRLTRSARSFIEAHEPELFLVVNRETDAPATLGATAVRFIRPWELGGTIGAFLAGAPPP